MAVQDVHVPVRLVITPEAGVPSAGVTSVGLVASTTFPVPVTPFSPNTPELLYSMSPFVPLVMVVVPTVRPDEPQLPAMILPLPSVAKHPTEANGTLAYPASVALALAWVSGMVNCVPLAVEMVATVPSRNVDVPNPPIVTVWPDENELLAVNVATLDVME